MATTRLTRTIEQQKAEIDNLKSQRRQMGRVPSGLPSRKWMVEQEFA
jgi:hypothetical protein